MPKTKQIKEEAVTEIKAYRKGVGDKFTDRNFEKVNYQIRNCRTITCAQVFFDNCISSRIQNFKHKLFDNSS